MPSQRGEAGSESNGSDSGGGGEGDKSGSDSNNESDDGGNFGDHINGNGVAEVVIVGGESETAVQQGGSWWQQ